MVCAFSTWELPWACFHLTAQRGLCMWPSFCTACLILKQVELVNLDSSGLSLFSLQRQPSGFSQARLKTEHPRITKGSRGHIFFLCYFPTLSLSALWSRSRPVGTTGTKNACEPYSHAQLSVSQPRSLNWGQELQEEAATKAVEVQAGLTMRAYIIFLVLHCQQELPSQRLFHLSQRNTSYDHALSCLCLPMIINIS